MILRVEQFIGPDSKPIQFKGIVQLVHVGLMF